MSPGGTRPVLGIEDDEGPACAPQVVGDGEASLSASDDDDVDGSRWWHGRGSDVSLLRAHRTRRARRGACQCTKPVGTYGLVGLQRNHCELRGVACGHL